MLAYGGFMAAAFHSSLERSAHAFFNAIVVVSPAFVPALCLLVSHLWRRSG
jgi:hypothetical protein